MRYRSSLIETFVSLYIYPYLKRKKRENTERKTNMAQRQSGKSFRSFLGIEPSKPTPEDSVLVIVDAQNEYGTPNPIHDL